MGTYQVETDEGTFEVETDEDENSVSGTASGSAAYDGTRFETGAEIGLPNAFANHEFYPGKETFGGQLAGAASNVPSDLYEILKLGAQVPGAAINTVLHPVDSTTKAYEAISQNPAGYADAGARLAAQGAGYAVGGAPGMLAGGGGYDQLMQLLGLHDDTPLSQDMAGLVGREGLEMGIASAIPKVAGSGARRVGGMMDNAFDREKAMMNAFTDNPADNIPGRANMPISQAIPELEEMGVFENPESLRRSKTPFRQLGMRIESAAIPERQAQSAALGAMDDIPLGELDPAPVLDANNAPTGAGRRAATNVGRQEMANLELGAFIEEHGPQNGPVEYAQHVADRRTLARLEQQSQAAARDPNMAMSQEQVARLDALRDSVGAGEDLLANYEVTPQRVHEIMSGQEGYAGQAKFEGSGGPLALQAQQFEKLWANARDLLSRGDPRYDPATRRLQAAQTTEPMIAARTGREGMNMSSDNLPATVRINGAGKPSLIATVGDYLGGRRPQDRLLQALGEAPTQRAGRAVEAFGDSVGNSSKYLSAFTGAETGMQSNDSAIENSISRRAPTNRYAQPAATAVDVAPLAPVTGPTNIIPRQLNLLPADVIPHLIQGFAAPQDVMPLAIQWKSVLAEGDKPKIAQFLGALIDKYPDMPFARGVVTGLSSEFDIGDGRVRLYSDIDRAKWADQIERSPLRTDEKAQRLRSLFQDSVVVPMDLKLSGFSKGPEVYDERAALQNVLSRSPQAQRVSSPLGYKRLQ